MPSPSWRVSRLQPVEDDSCEAGWTIVLAGGEGTRLSAYVQQRFNRRIPKQYCRILGTRSMLEHTLDRLNRLTPPSRTLTVIGTDHDAFAAPQLAGKCDHVVTQPCARGTAHAVYVALAMIKRWTPNAIVTITASDHYVAPEAHYVEQVRAARAIADAKRELVVMLGVRPTEPDPELGYLELGGRLVDVPAVWHVERFAEKPAVARAKDLVARGALWNTMVMSGSVNALWDLGRAAAPQFLNVLDLLCPLVGTIDEDHMIDCIYRTLPALNFSSDIVARAASAHLVAVELEGVEWSDWGNAKRIEAVIAGSSSLPRPTHSAQR